MSGMFVVTLHDVIGIAGFALVALIAIVVGCITAARQASCKRHEWRFVDPSYGNKYWQCKQCGKQHDSVNKPTDE